MRDRRTEVRKRCPDLQERSQPAHKQIREQDREKPCQPSKS